MEVRNERVLSGRRGGLATKEKQMAVCPDYYRTIGRKGGQCTLAKYGRQSYSMWGKLGGRGHTREERLKSAATNEAPAGVSVVTEDSCVSGNRQG